MRPAETGSLRRLDGLTASYARQGYSRSDRGITIVGSPAGTAGGVPIDQDVVMAIADTDGVVERTVAPGHGA
ncbi:MAG: hypothetical protein O3B31_06630 [Chloroflexi bacterium]|nr:hypothetical protein [Chloroflexota bacterium]MDA1003009.1 hypothetical protein [Chloroflexota bacterium]